MTFPIVFQAPSTTFYSSFLLLLHLPVRDVWGNIQTLTSPCRKQATAGTKDTVVNSFSFEVAFRVGAAFWEHLELRFGKPGDSMQRKPHLPGPSSWVGAAMTV